jgi:hypothetical protein
MPCHGVIRDAVHDPFVDSFINVCKKPITKPPDLGSTCSLSLPKFLTLPASLNKQKDLFCQGIGC